jgi:hypothetical protein
MRTGLEIEHEIEALKSLKPKPGPKAAIVQSEIDIAIAELEYGIRPGDPGDDLTADQWRALLIAVRWRNDAPMRPSDHWEGLVE